MMKMFTYHCSQHHDVVTRMVTSKNARNARLRDSGVYDVSDDERLPADPLLILVFPPVLSGLISSTRLVAVVFMMMMMRMISNDVMSFPLFLFFGYLMPKGE